MTRERVGLAAMLAALAAASVVLAWLYYGAPRP